MLLPQAQRCNSPSSITPLDAADLAQSMAASAALAQAVQNAQSAVNSILTRSPFDFAAGGQNLMTDVARYNVQHGVPGFVGGGSPIPGAFSNVSGSRRTGRYKPGFVGQGECLPDAPGVDISVQSRTAGTAPFPVVTIPPVAVPMTAACPSTGNICLDLRNGYVLASRVSPAVLFACSQKGYAGNCPACDTGGPAVEVSDATLAAIPLVDSASLGACPQLRGMAGLRRGLGDAAYPVSAGAYPISCMASPGSVNDKDTGIDYSWIGWGLLLVGGVWLASTAGRRRA